MTGGFRLQASPVLGSRAGFLGCRGRSLPPAAAGCEGPQGARQSQAQSQIGPERFRRPVANRLLDFSPTGGNGCYRDGACPLLDGGV